MSTTVKAVPAHIQNSVFVWCAAILMLTWAVSAACDRGHAVTYDNQSDAAVMLLKDGAQIATLGPHERKVRDLLELHEAATFTAVTDGGQIPYTETLTWNELRGHNWTIVIPPTK